jgi:uncharacterized membrane protein YdbT with pleckstrin-like domain
MTTPTDCCILLLPAEEELVERELFLARQQQERVQLQQQAAADLLPDPLQAVADVVSAYTAEQGFRQMSVQELSVALTAGGLIDLLLDVRSHEEFTAGVRHAIISTCIVRAPLAWTQALAAHS